MLAWLAVWLLLAARASAYQGPWIENARATFYGEDGLGARPQLRHCLALPPCSVCVHPCCRI